MDIIINIVMIYGLTFIIGFMVSCIIWALFAAMTTKKDTGKI